MQQSKSSGRLASLLRYASHELWSSPPSHGAVSDLGTSAACVADTSRFASRTSAWQQSLTICHLNSYSTAEIASQAQHPRALHSLTASAGQSGNWGASGSSLIGHSWRPREDTGARGIHSTATCLAEHKKPRGKGSAGKGTTVSEPAASAEAQDEAPVLSRPAQEMPSYEEIFGGKVSTVKVPALRAVQRAQVAERLKAFAASPRVRDDALALYVNSQLFSVVSSLFRKQLLKSTTPGLREALLAATPGRPTEELLFPLFAEYVLNSHGREIKRYRDLVKSVDLTKPYVWYPMARALKRRIIYHSGPTNSGKTYSALQAMMAAKEGVYCGPLRLLAMEIYDECNASGTYCNLYTGQERNEVEGALHTSCTIEMVNMLKRYDVAVIDEIQMIGDESRGWAWTRALQGVPANEVHLCGDGSALPLVRTLCSAMGEELEVHEYERFTPLRVEERGLRGRYSNVMPGDCIVAFSRKDIFTIKQVVEKETGLATCVIYGALPPEMRRLQARLFNERDNEFTVLVASDAVGMGLNLNIRRIIFHTLQKYDGKANARTPVSVSMIKQIAGRSGRRNSEFKEGLATTLRSSDAPTLREALEAPASSLSTPTAGLFPEFEHLEAFAGQLPDLPFPDLLTRFGEEARLGGSYFLCQQDDVMRIARELEAVKSLSLEDRFQFAMAPCNTRNPRGMAELLKLARSYSAREPLSFSSTWIEEVPRSSEELKLLEEKYQVLSLWRWLSLRFGEEHFPGAAQAEELAQQMVGLMDLGLQALSKRQVMMMSERNAPGKRRSRAEISQAKAAAANLSEPNILPPPVTEIEQKMPRRGLPDLTPDSAPTFPALLNTGQPASPNGLPQPPQLPPPTAAAVNLAAAQLEARGEAAFDTALLVAQERMAKVVAARYLQDMWKKPLSQTRLNPSRRISHKTSASAGARANGWGTSAESNSAGINRRRPWANRRGGDLQSRVLGDGPAYQQSNNGPTPPGESIKTDTADTAEEGNVWQRVTTWLQTAISGTASTPTEEVVSRPNLAAEGQIAGGIARASRSQMSSSWERIAPRKDPLAANRSESAEFRDRLAERGKIQGHSHVQQAKGRYKAAAYSGQETESAGRNSRAQGKVVQKQETQRSQRRARVDSLISELKRHNIEVPEALQLVDPQSGALPGSSLEHASQLAAEARRWTQQLQRQRQAEAAIAPQHRR